MPSISFRCARVIVAVLFLSTLLAQTGSVLAQDPTTTGIDGNTYTSPIFGYSINWDEAIWTPGEELSEDGFDAIYLGSDMAGLYFEGMYFYNGDPEECIKGERVRNAEEGGLDDLEPMTDEDGVQVAESDEENAYALYTVPAAEDGSSDEFVVYIECQVIVPNSAVLVITALFAPDDDQVTDEIDAVLESFELGVGGESTFTSSDLEETARDSGNDIDAFWASVFDENGLTYVDPAFITFQGPIETDCGDAFGGDSGPFYCPSDQTVYIDIDYFDAELLPLGIVVIRVVMAHEIAHHVQELLGLQGCDADPCGELGASMAIELQADCLAGVWTKDAAERDIISESDLKRVEITATEYFGDPPGTPIDDPEAHGSGESRDEMFTAGYTEGIDACGFE